MHFPELLNVFLPFLYVKSEKRTVFHKKRNKPGLRKPAENCRRKTVGERKPVRKEKTLDPAKFPVDLTTAHRPERRTTPGGTVIRFRRNATEFRAERARKINRKFCRISIFRAQIPTKFPLDPEGLPQRCNVQSLVPPASCHDTMKKPGEHCAHTPCSPGFPLCIQRGRYGTKAKSLFKSEPVAYHCTYRLVESLQP